MRPAAASVNAHGRELNRPNTRLAPIVADSVGHGRSPNGAAYTYVVQRSVSRKWGYTVPNATSSTPVMTAGGAPMRTGSMERRLASQTKMRNSVANAAPLKGLPEASDAADTDKTGNASTIPATRLEGRQPTRIASSETARATCHATAICRHSLATDARPIRISSCEGIFAAQRSSVVRITNCKNHTRGR